jgi:hypothetical protein
MASIRFLFRASLSFALLAAGPAVAADALSQDPAAGDGLLSR